MAKEFDVMRLGNDLATDVSIPAGKRGRCAIEHKMFEIGESLPVVSMRNSIFCGFRASSIQLMASPFMMTILKEDGLTWMSDSPQEIFLHHFAIDAAKGDVLIGGLGIGYSAQKIARKKGVRSVTVVEKSRDIIALVQPHLRRPDIRVVHADLFAYLKATTDKFNFCFFDIWRSTGENEIKVSVDPLRKLAPRVLKRGGRVMCWGEEEMRGQVSFRQGIAGADGKLLAACAIKWPET